MIYIVEGEKDVLAVEGVGGVATCNPGGAGKWRAEFSGTLANARCRVVADDDDPGIQHALNVAQSLSPLVSELELLRPARGKDISDHLSSDLGLDDLVPLPSGVSTKGTERPGKEENRSDTGNARLFAEMHGQNVRFDFRADRWLVWQGHCWAPDDDGKVLRMAGDVARRRYDDAWSIHDKGDAAKAAKFAIGCENRIRVLAMLELARAQPPIADNGKDWNRDPMLLGVPNGVIDLKSGRLRAGWREDRISMQVQVPYNPDAICPRWLRFNKEVFGGDEALIEFIQRAVGYSLTGNIDEQCLFLLHGAGANGKSTFLNAIRSVVGDYGYNMPFATLELKRSASIPNDLAALVGRRLVTSSETNEATRLNEGRVKALTGGDPVTARFLHQEFFTFRPECVTIAVLTATG